MKKLTLLILAGVLIPSCSHQGVSQLSDQQVLDAKVAQETQITSTQDLSAEARQLIQTTPGLSENERSQLLELQNQAETQMATLRLESIRLRSVLVKDIMSTNYNNNEVKLIRKRIKKLEDRKTDLIFNTLDQANKILGNTPSPQKETVVRHFLDMRGFHNDRFPE